MLQIIRTMSELPFGALLDIYADNDRVTLQEQYDYLRDCFFRLPGAALCLWLEGDKPVSALRLEPYRDGLLLTALETAPYCRNQGYARALVRAVLEQWKGTKLYSHIDRKNLASRSVHKHCGFRKIADNAVYLDGSVSARADTYLFYDN